MAKNKEEFNDNIQEENVSIVSVPQSELARFEHALNPFEVQAFNDLMPEWIAGDSLVGQLIQIHNATLLESFALKTDFYKCDIEVAGLEGKFTATFFSVGVKTFFKALLAANLPFPIVVGVIRQRNTYAFQDVNKFLANNR